jgi:hypothetical protein
MLSAIVSFIASIPAIIKMISQILGLVADIRRAFQENPVDVIKEGQEKQKEAEDNATQNDNTDGIFGGKQ